MNSQIEQRILQISKDHKLSHLSSCLNAAPILDQIYQNKAPEDKVVLSTGHAGLALYAVMEAYGQGDAEDLLARHGIHPNRREPGIDCATGSLGCGIAVSLGMAMSNRDINVHCILSDGECMEGSAWESLRLKTEFEVDNLKTHVIINGFGAYGAINRYELEDRLKLFDPLINIYHVSNPKGFEGFQGHYKTI